MDSIEEVQTKLDARIKKLQTPESRRRFKEIFNTPFMRCVEYFGIMHCDLLGGGYVDKSYYIMKDGTEVIEEDKEKWMLSFEYFKEFMKKQELQNEKNDKENRTNS